MNMLGKLRKKGGLFAPACAVAVMAAGLPTAGFAIGELDTGLSFADASNFASFTPASVDPRVAQLVASRSTGQARMMRFTPAGVSERSSRSVTVAVRVDEDEARAISVRSAIASVQQDKVAAANPAVRIAPTRYNLGISRGYSSFANTPVLNRNLSEAEIPDLADFKPSPGARPADSRFAARVSLEEQRNAGSAPRTIDSLGEQSLDVEGSYRLTRNLDVTAGVRYSQERDRVAPIVDPLETDTQAVYIGTQFRF